MQDEPGGGAAGRPPFHHAGDQVDQLDRYALHLEIGRLQPGQRQQVGNQALQVTGLDQHGLPGPLSTVRTDHTVSDCLRVTL